MVGGTMIVWWDVRALNPNWLVRGAARITGLCGYSSGGGGQNLWIVWNRRIISHLIIQLLPNWDPWFHCCWLLFFWYSFCWYSLNCWCCAMPPYCCMGSWFYCCCMLAAFFFLQCLYHPILVIQPSCIPAWRRRNIRLQPSGFPPIGFVQEAVGLWPCIIARQL